MGLSVAILGTDWMFQQDGAHTAHIYKHFKKLDETRSKPLRYCLLFFVAVRKHSWDTQDRHDLLFLAASDWTGLNVAWHSLCGECILWKLLCTINHGGLMRSGLVENAGDEEFFDGQFFAWKLRERCPLAVVDGRSYWARCFMEFVSIYSFNYFII